MKQAIIIGNSGAARECYWLLKDMESLPNARFPAARFKGFLSFEGHQGYLADLADYTLGSDDDYRHLDGDVFIIGIGQPELRLKAYHKWQQKGVEFLTLVHPNAHVAENAQLGEANIFANGCFVSCNTQLGNANFLNGFVIMGHDARMGHGNFFGTFTQLLGEAGIENANSFGTGSVLLPKGRMGSRNIVAPGAYIYKGCGDNCRLSGNPAHDIS